MRAMPSVGFTALLLLGPLHAATAQTPAARRDTIRALAADRVAKGGSAGMVIGTFDGATPITVAVGAGITDRSIFEIGSISKVLTTVLLADMVGRGEVALDDPVRKHLPAGVSVPAWQGREITLLDLATATSGLPSLPDAPLDPTNPYAAFRAADLHAWLGRYALTRAPGSAYEYSNVGMGLLGHALAHRLGMSYEAAVIARILDPLGMRETRITLTPALRARLAPPHDGDLEPSQAWDFDVLAGAGGWRSTIGDMLRLLDAVRRPPATPLGRAIALATVSRRPTGVPALSIGLGFHVAEKDGARIVWHNGETGGYHSFLGVDGARGGNVVILSNSTRDIDDLGFHLVDARSALRPPPAPRPRIAVAPVVLDSLVGRYALTPDFIVAITREDDRLYLQATAQPRFRLFAATPRRFFLTVVAAEVSFTADAAGRITGLVLHQNGRDTPGRRLP